MAFLLRFAASVIALYLTVALGRALDQHAHGANLHLYLAPGFAGVEAAFIAAVVLGLANAIIRPILRLIALPITCLTLGLFSVVINAALFWATGQITPGYHVRGLISALFGTLCMGLAGGLINTLLLSARDRSAKRDMVQGARRRA